MTHPTLALALVATLGLPGAALAVDKYALVVGVENYIPDQLPELDYAEDDALRIAESLRRLDFRVTTMTSAATNEPLRDLSAAGILRQAERLFADRDADDTLVLVFAGHGVQFPDDESLWLCPAPARLADRTTLLPLDRLLKLAAGSGSQQKLLLVDTGRQTVTMSSGRAAADGDPAGGFNAAAPRRRAAAEDRGTAPPGTVVFFACEPDDRAFELIAIEGSVFLHYVRAFLEGEAPADRYPRREVLVEELVPFVRNGTRDTVDGALIMTQVPQALVPAAGFPSWSLGTITR